MKRTQTSRGITCRSGIANLAGVLKYTAFTGSRDPEEVPLQALAQINDNIKTKVEQNGGKQNEQRKESIG